MKAIIYTGISLFSLASVYGLADYFNSKKSGLLDNLYKEETAPLETAKGQPIAIVPAAINLPASLPLTYPKAPVNTVMKASKKKLPKRSIRLEEFSRSRIIEQLPEELKIPEIKKDKPVLVIDTKSVAEKLNGMAKSNEVLKPERRISLDMFSRAPLRRPIKINKEKKLTETVPEPFHL